MKTIKIKIKKYLKTENLRFLLKRFLYFVRKNTCEHTMIIIIFAAMACYSLEIFSSFTPILCSASSLESTLNVLEVS